MPVQVACVSCVPSPEPDVVRHFWVAMLVKCQ